MVDSNERPELTHGITPVLQLYPQEHEDFETIKQTESADCGAAVVAMAVGMPLEYVKRDMIRTSMELEGVEHFYYKAREIVRYLACHGILMGMHARAADGEYCDLNRSSFIDFKWPMRDFPAILAVKSARYKDQDHWVFWDGKFVRDPSPLVTDELSELDGYKVLDIFPIIHYTE